MVQVMAVYQEVRGCRSAMDVQSLDCQRLPWARQKSHLVPYYWPSKVSIHNLKIACLTTKDGSLDADLPAFRLRLLGIVFSCMLGYLRYKTGRSSNHKIGGPSPSSVMKPMNCWKSCAISEGGRIVAVISLWKPGRLATAPKIDAVLRAFAQG